MIKVNVFEIKARLSEYLDRAAQGERIVVCRHNKPVAELRALEPGRTEPRPIGPLPGRPPFDVRAAFFEPLADAEQDAWEQMPSIDPLAAAWAPRTGGGASSVAEAKSKAPKRPRRGPKRRRP